MDCCQTYGKEKTSPELRREKEEARSDCVQLRVSESVIRTTKVELNVEAKCLQVGNNNITMISDPETSQIKMKSSTINTSTFAKPRATGHENRRPVLRLTKGPNRPIRVGGRISHKGFPDENDHEFLLTAFKNNFPGSNERLKVDFYNNNKRGKRYEITPSVTLCELGDQTKETKAIYQVKLLRSGIKGEALFAFRFHNRQAKLSIKFILEVVPAQGSSKSKREVVNEVTVEVNTVNGKPRQRKMRDKRDVQRDSRDHYSASGSEVCETELEFMKTLCILRKLPPSSASEESIGLSRNSYQIMRELHHPRDNGRWRDFDALADKLAARAEYCDGDSQIAIMLERSVAACYRDDLDRSAEMILEILQTLKDPSSALNRRLLAGRAYHYLAGVYRRQKKLGAAEECVELAEQSLHDTGTNLDKSFLAYERGSVVLELMARNSDVNPLQILQAKKFLERCIDLCISLEQSDDTLYVKKHHFAFIKVAMLLLDCRSTAGRQRAITADNIQEAKEGLDTLAEKYWDDIAQGEKIQYYLGRADQFYRDRSYTRAEEFAQKALKMAKTLAFNTEIEPARARLQAIQANLPRKMGVQLDLVGCSGSDLTLGSSTTVTLTSPAEFEF